MLRWLPVFLMAVAFVPESRAQLLRIERDAPPPALGPQEAMLLCAIGQTSVEDVDQRPPLKRGRHGDVYWYVVPAGDRRIDLRLDYLRSEAVADALPLSFQPGSSYRIQTRINPYGGGSHYLWMEDVVTGRKASRQFAIFGHPRP